MTQSGHPWALPSDEESLLRLAKGYPFAAPAESFLYRDGEAGPLPDDRPDLFEGRAPVIAHGSNRSPHQLKRKFDYLSGRESEIPVINAWLSDHDVVYSAHVTQYGAMAANLQYIPGARVEISVTWLTAAQLVRMHETELGGENYAYGEMRGIELSLESGPCRELETARVYISTHGCLNHSGPDAAPRPVGLAALRAEGRDYEMLDQEAALTLVRDRHRPGWHLDRHILETIRNPLGRRQLVGELRRTAIPAAAPHFEELLR